MLAYVHNNHAAVLNTEQLIQQIKQFQLGNLDYL